jgi:hypothetical protein
MADLLEAHGSPAEALYAIQLEAQNRVDAAAWPARGTEVEGTDVDADEA